MRGMQNNEMKTWNKVSLFLNFNKYLNKVKDSFNILLTFCR